MIVFNLPILLLYISVLLLSNRKLQNIVSFVTVLLITAVSGTRYYSDIDYRAYIDLFNETPILADLTLTDILILYGEPGYLIFTSLVKSIGFDFVAVTILFSMVSISIKLHVCARLVRNYFIAFSLFLCLHFVTVEFIELRWALSSALVMLAIFFEFKNKRKLFLIYITLAIIFHYFSLLFLCVPFFRIISFRKGVLVFFLSFLIALSYKVTSPSLSYSVDSEIYIIRRLFRYLNDPDSSVGLFSYLRIFMYLIFIHTVYLFRERFTAFDIELAKYSSLLISLSLIISFVPLLYFRSMVISDFFMILVMINVIFKFRLVYRCFFIVGLSILFSIWNVIDVSNYQAAGYIFEYKSWFSFLI